MERSLSVLLPVRDAQSSLAAMVKEALEVASELSGQFELVIIDDGSTDATSEVACELSRRYPQVRAVYHRRCLGREVAIRSGIVHSSGEMIILRDENAGLPLDAVSKLWRDSDGKETVEDAPSESDKWTRFSVAHRVCMAGYRVCDRRTMEGIHGLGKPAAPNYLTRLERSALGE